MTNEYLNTLLDPALNPGVKVPDVDSFPSSTFYATADLTLTTDATGRAAYAFTPMVTSALLNGVYNNATSRFDWTVQNWGSVASFTATYSMIRPVSAEISVCYIGTTQNDSGMICGYSIPRGRNIASSFTSALAQYTSVTVPIRDGLRVLYKPTDNHDFEYSEVGLAGWATGPDYIPTYKSACGIFISGATPNTAVAMVRIHANFEAIPNNDTFGMVTVEPSPSALGMFEQALNYVSTIPAAFPLNAPMINSVLAGGAGAVGLYAQNLLRQQQAIGFDALY